MPLTWRRPNSGRLALTAGLACALAFMLATVDAKAQTRTFYLDRALISGAPDDGFMVWRPIMHPEERFYLGGGPGLSINPLRKDNVTEDARVKSRIDNPVKAQFQLYLHGGAQFRNRFSGNVTLPFVLGQITGEDPQRYGVGAGGLSDAGTALGDMRVDLRALAHETDDKGFRVGGGVSFFLPTGSSTSYASDDQASIYLFLNGELTISDFLLAGSVGPHFRPPRGLPGDEASLFIAEEMRYAFGVYTNVRDDLRLGGELWGHFGIGTGIPASGSSEDSTVGNGNNVAVEWLGQARFQLEKYLYANIGGGTRLSNGYGAADVRVLASIGYTFKVTDVEPESPAERKLVIVPDKDDYDPDRDGDGIPDAIDDCPDVKEDGKPPDKTDGCPAPADRDQDGIIDAEDKCPDEPEDKDGIQDADGCPEEDADNDQVPDVEDACPTDPGPASDIAEKNGCPSRTQFEEDGTITLLEPIQFEYNSATIKPVSFPILDEVVVLMKAQPKTRVGVYGHTDSKGGHEYNVRLSQQRAASVLRYLTQEGIDKERLESDGFGPDKPIAPNDTEEGRAKNRRVEFKVLEGLGE